ncbi:hypothetical protein EcloH_3649 [Enterobacter ludwigii]|nr:hypothetical protein EcloH_3649 [Enterobacter ludwigii]
MGTDGRKPVIDRAQLGAQGFDMRIHGTIEAIAVFAPHFVHKLLARKDPARRLQQCFEQQEFVARER